VTTGKSGSKAKMKGEEEKCLGDRSSPPQNITPFLLIGGLSYFLEIIF
jgi:hypothetical protein